MIAQKIYYINSANRSSGTNENFSYYMFVPLEQYDRVVVLQVNIPISYYIVNAPLNTFTLIEGVQSATVTIPPGNYTALSFITIVVPLINAASPNHWTYSMTLPNQFSQTMTAKYTYTVAGNTSQPSISIPTGSVIGEQLGFNAGSTNTFSGNSLVSSNVLKFIPEDTLFLHSDMVDNGGQDDILQEVYANNSIPLSNAVYQLSTFPDAYSKKLKTNSSNTFHFSLTDENGNSISLNGLNMLITLLLYRKDNSGDIQKKYIEYMLLKEKQTDDLQQQLYDIHEEESEMKHQLEQQQQQINNLDDQQRQQQNQAEQNNIPQPQDTPENI